MRIYVARHGETDGNRNGLVIGRTDEPLNYTGEKQAHELGERLQSVPFSICYTSPLQRAVQTAEIALKDMKCDCSIVESKELIEQNYGFLEGTLIRSNRYHDYKDRIFCRFPHGESYLDMVARIYPFMDELIHNLEEKYPYVLIMTHGQPCKIIETFFHDVYEENFRSMYVENCQFTIYDI